MRVITKRLSQLTPHEYKACHYLNFRAGGTMMYSLKDNKNSPDAYAIMAWEYDPKRRGPQDDHPKLLGWALMVPHKDERHWPPTDWQRRKSKYVNQFYVRKSYRGQKIGTRLITEVKKFDPVPLVIPHDTVSGDFFANHTVVTDQWRRGLITSAKKRKKRNAA